MIYELRTYDLGIGKLPGYLRLFETVGYEILSRYAQPVGYWFAETGVLNRIHHMWAYESRAQRAENRAALYADPAWLKDFIPYALPHLQRQTNVMLSLEDGDPLTHHRAQATDGKWIYEFAELSDGALPLGDDGIALFRYASGDLKKRLMVRAFADETRLAADARWPDTATVRSDIYHPTPFSRLQ